MKSDKYVKFTKFVLEKSIRVFFKTYFRLIHRIEIFGMENIPKDAGRLIIISNHASFYDGPILWAFLNIKFKILVDRFMAEIPILKPFMKNEYTVQIDPLNSYTLKEAIDIVENETPLLIFPEGRISTTGGIMKIYNGAGFIAYKTMAKILPIYIKNNYQVPTSRAPGKKHFFKKLTVTIDRVREPVKVDHVPGKLKRQESTSCIYNILTDICCEAHNVPALLGKEFIRICKENKNDIAFADVTRKMLTYKKALISGILLGGYFEKFKDKNIGILLPNLTITMILFFALQLMKKVPAFLNYSTGVSALGQAMDLASLNVIVTSKTFLEKVRLNLDVFAGKKVVFIEDLKESFGLKDKLKAMFKYRFASLFYKMNEAENKDTAVILFTSGSEGVPKGVCLSHENIISNIYQILSRIDIRKTDYGLNALPIFHSFGLTVGTLVPFFQGARIFLYVSPLHYRVIPEVAYDYNCTIMLGTNTFLNGFSKKAHPYDFYAMRYIFSGAEALTDTVFDKYAKTYGIRVMSGYGATECSPVISMNNAIEYEHGTVGRILPGIEYKIIPIEGIEYKDGKKGRFYVKGKNTMKGYLKNDKANQKYLVEDSGWYDTGDIVEITEKGFLKIAGRMKRFAKISGEMVSLTAVEDALLNEFGERRETAIMAVPDEKKGEKLIVVADSELICLKDVREVLKNKGFSEITYPREIKYLKDIPKLGTGKIDYIKLREILN
jgi:acyl-[acyl-carrier-protein]-phospholipid O-acyltransferase/long-chain-fatty-acid--[acyl-carrier-protein] ligase